MVGRTSLSAPSIGCLFLFSLLLLSSFFFFYRFNIIPEDNQEDFCQKLLQTSANVDRRSEYSPPNEITDEVRGEWEEIRKTEKLAKEIIEKEEIVLKILKGEEDRLVDEARKLAEEEKRIEMKENVEEEYLADDDEEEEQEDIFTFIGNLHATFNEKKNRGELTLDDWKELIQFQSELDKKHKLFTNLWRSIQWEYRGDEDATKDYVIWNSFDGLTSTEKEEIDETFSQLASKYPCENNIWCDSWYNQKETLEVQRYLWNHQHPADCTKARILHWKSFQSGMGSIIHTLGVVLSFALNTNRVLIMDDGADFRDEEHCGRLGTTECYFLPLSNCTWENAIQSLEGEDPELSTEYPWEEPQHSDKRVLAAWFGNEICSYGTVPNSYIQKGLYWWRAQAARYVARPRDSLVEYVKKQKRFIFRKYGGKIPHPIMSVHIRHGDKGQEAELYSLDEYMEQVFAVKEKYGITKVFLSTEDPEVIEEAIGKYSDEFEIFYHDIPRLNTDPWSSSRELGPVGESLISYTTLLVASECDVFVGTRQSNFCRLIDEFRKGFGRARIPYYDPGDRRFEWGGWWDQETLSEEEKEKYLSICQVEIEGQPTEFDSNLLRKKQQKSKL